MKSHVSHASLGVVKFSMGFWEPKKKWGPLLQELIPDLFIFSDQDSHDWAWQQKIMTARFLWQDSRLVMETWARAYSFTPPFRWVPLADLLNTLGRKPAYRFAGHGLYERTLQDPLGRRITLGQTQARLLRCLMVKEQLSPQDWVKQVWPYDRLSIKHLFETHLGLLRRSLFQAGGSLDILAEEGFYALKASSLPRP